MKKSLRIPYSDPTYMSYTSVDELPKHIFQELKHFFSVYKQLEGKKTEAIAIIQEAMDSYQKKFWFCSESGDVKDNCIFRKRCLWSDCHRKTLHF